MRVADEDLSNLTLPGTYFARSEISRTSFRNADLRHSTFCWNDFVDVDFRDACLADCDLRAATFERCRFDGADLRGATLDSDCSIVLSSAQRATVVWSDDEPDGG
ncbi:MAG: pentapeptide repeat-containing protein [Kofleriaceae bacterium]